MRQGQLERVTRVFEKYWVSGEEGGGRERGGRAREGEKKMKTCAGCLCHILLESNQSLFYPSLYCLANPCYADICAYSIICAQIDYYICVQNNTYVRIKLL